MVDKMLMVKLRAVDGLELQGGQAFMRSSNKVVGSVSARIYKVSLVVKVELRLEPLKDLCRLWEWFSRVKVFTVRSMRLWVVKR
jgi:hypothetical protein